MTVGQVLLLVILYSSVDMTAANALYPSVHPHNLRN